MFPPGQQLAYLPPGFEDYGGHGILSPAGAVVTEFTTADTKVWTTALFASPSDGKTFTDLSVSGQAGGSVEFCGTELFQMVRYSRTIAVLHRSGSGQILSSKTFAIGKHLGGAQFQCNSSTGVISLHKDGKHGRTLAERTFSFDLK